MTRERAAHPPTKTRSRVPHFSRPLREVGLSRTAGVNLSIAPNPLPEVRSNPSPITKAQGSAPKTHEHRAMPGGQSAISRLFSCHNPAADFFVCASERGNHPERLVGNTRATERQAVWPGTTLSALLAVAQVRTPLAISVLEPDSRVRPVQHAEHPWARKDLYRNQNAGHGGSREQPKTLSLINTPFAAPFAIFLSRTRALRNISNTIILGTRSQKGRSLGSIPSPVSIASQNLIRFSGKSTYAMSMAKRKLHHQRTSLSRLSREFPTRQNRLYSWARFEPARRRKRSIREVRVG
jgi:hypothetical protein